ncbi:MAG: TolC family protein, partial [Pseudomonadales bacterium]
MNIKKVFLAAAITAASVQAVTAEPLNIAVSSAVLSNPQVQSVKNARNAVFEEVKQARGGYLPTIDVGAGYGYERTDNQSTTGDVELNRREANVSLNQMLFDGFRVSSEVARQSARLDAINSRLREVAEETALEAARAYLELLKREELLLQAKETLLTHVRIFDQIKRRSDQGVGTLASIQQAEGRLALAEVNVLSAENNLLDAKSAYQRVTGQYPDDTLEDPEIDPDLIPTSFDEAKERTFANHPTLKLAESDVKAARAQYEAARSL